MYERQTVSAVRRELLARCFQPLELLAQLFSTHAYVLALGGQASADLLRVWTVNSEPAEREKGVRNEVAMHNKAIEGDA